MVESTRRERAGVCDTVVPSCVLFVTAARLLKRKRFACVDFDRYKSIFYKVMCISYMFGEKSGSFRCFIKLGLKGRDGPSGLRFTSGLFTRKRTKYSELYSSL